MIQNSNKDQSVMIIALYHEMLEMYQKRLNELHLGFTVDLPKKSNFGHDEKNILRTLKSLLGDHVKMVITRGVMAKTIRDHFDIHVIEANVSEYTVLKTLMKYRNYEDVIGVVECPTLTKTIRRTAELLGLKVMEFPVMSFDDFNPQIDHAISAGIKVIFGGLWTFHNPEVVKEKDVTIEILLSSEEEINESVTNALIIYKQLNEAIKRNELLNSVVNYSMEGIIAVDNLGTITTFNHEAQKVLGIKEKDALGRHIQSVLPHLNLDNALKNRKISLGDVCRLNNIETIMNKAPLIVKNETEGAIATFLKVDDIQEIEKNTRMRLTKKGLTAKMTFEHIKGTSEITKKNIARAQAYAQIDSTVLLTGETGTGKEVFAQAIHNGSQRKSGPFVAINCSALPPNLLESELFGYVDGAFTGARKGGKQGLFELAHGGTIFLDEIGELDMSLQVRLLRVLQEREIMRIGDDRIIPVDVRIISATNRNLKMEMNNGNFRSDLYYRLNILNVHLPPLRSRIEDIEDLVHMILESTNRSLRFKVSGIDERMMASLKNHNWPGNVRELKNVIEKIVVMTQTGVARFESLNHIIEDLEVDTCEDSSEDLYKMTLPEIESLIIQRVLKEEGYNKKRTAERLGIGRSTLFRKLSSEAQSSKL